jgi:hypothetical protein
MSPFGFPSLLSFEELFSSALPSFLFRRLVNPCRASFSLLFLPSSLDLWNGFESIRDTYTHANSEEEQYVDTAR